MEGNAKIIKLIARDENIHLSFTTYMLKTLLIKDDPDYAEIAEETRDECIQIFMDAIKQEKSWAKYLFSDGSLIGLNESLLADFVDFRGALCMRAVGLPVPFTAPKTNPLPWTNSWIDSSSVQVAPQQTEITSYVIGGVNQDASENSFSGFSL